MSVMYSRSPGAPVLLHHGFEDVAFTPNFDDVNSPE
jgi:hypothetical protein